MKNVIITDENFIWLDITPQVKCGVKEIQDIWLNHPIYALHEDGTESLLESNEEIDEALILGLKIGMEVGYLPKPKSVFKDTWFKDADKILKDGYWYAKINDIKFG